MEDLFAMANAFAGSGLDFARNYEKNFVFIKNNP